MMLRHELSVLGPPGHAAQARLGRPRDDGGAGPAAANRAARSPARHARHAAVLAPPPDHPQVDVFEPGRPSVIHNGSMAYIPERGSRYPCPLTAGGLVIHAVCGKNPVHAQAIAAR